MVANVRPNWDEFWLSFLPIIGQRASCDRGRSGALIVRDKRILSLGWVGAPIGLPSCDEEDHIFETRLPGEIPKNLQMIDRSKLSQHCVRTFHSELNAIINCAKEGISTRGATLYCTMVPCRNCAMAIIQAEIKRVVALNNYQTGHAHELFESTGIELSVVSIETLY